ncbi:hypothetical protein PRZ48_009512 [Zasmidium cellare]|uniref:Glucose-methanol-choline oxidoreductase N-terminal domain-containing protein n=1 Tax=Zasmidium cellare TaxID=395010 RepID=A0ABR0ECK5_ZASCE|nr:hypothetical protein PRZ48_009512 [Zasmidium cellare]
MSPGPAGALLASRLARSSSAPSVLLLEAGGANDNASLEQRMISKRLETALTYPDLNWGYKTVPQSQLANRVIDYSRGKGLGGSSLINYAFWTVPPSADYDRWASVVGDNTFSWKKMQQRLKKLERYHSDVEGPIKQYFSPSKQNHGTNGPLDIEVPRVIEPEVVSFFADFEKAGTPINRDLNSGNPIGVGIMASSSYRALRTTAQSAFLEHLPGNLIVKVDSPVDRIVLEDKVAVGVEVDGTIYRASKEVIICAGAIDTPKLLMLSGIGNEDELNRHSIAVNQHLPGMGRNLQDHVWVLWGYQRKASAPPTQSYDACHNNEAAADARRQLEEHGAGPFAVNGQGYVLGFLKDEATLKSNDFRALPSAVQAHLNEPTVPTYETAWGLMHPMPGMDPAKSYLAMGVLLQNTQSVGTVRLASSNPKDTPICDPALLTHPFDRTAFINAIKAAATVPGSPVVSGDVDFPLNAPTFDSDEEVWSFIQQNAGATWHMSCTVKMGKADDESACVDTDFRLRGIKNLRVADMSVTPFLPSAHPVSTAYLVGETAAERLVAEYDLDTQSKA